MASAFNIETLTDSLPDKEAAQRFYSDLSEKYPAEARRIGRSEGLLSDVLALSAFSPLLAATMLESPQYFQWLDRQRSDTKVRSKEQLLESLARFSLTNSNIEARSLLGRFRRRELLRIYLRDIRRLGTIAEITEEISNLADAELEYALGLARQDMENRYGAPLEVDAATGKAKTARFCVTALGKLGSRELNYSSDIDLLFVYSSDGTTSGTGSRGALTNREFFVKLAEQVIKTAGEAYRVDMRLRPHGRVGALAISVRDAVQYYKLSAQPWERQVLIRSRSSAGDQRVFKVFYRQVEGSVYSADESVESALRNVRLSKEKINSENKSDRGFNVKLGRGGIREIEFIAQALQLAYGGRDEWLRAAHTLISITRLADRGHLTEQEITELSDAYDFLRRLEHRLQMEHGLQTHVIPPDRPKRQLVAARMGLSSERALDEMISLHTSNVSRVFDRVFKDAARATNKSEGGRSMTAAGGDVQPACADDGSVNETSAAAANFPEPSSEILIRIFASLGKSGSPRKLSGKERSSLALLCRQSPAFGEMIATNPSLLNSLPGPDFEFPERNYNDILASALRTAADFPARLSALRKTWSPLLLEIAAGDIFERLDLHTVKQRQTELAEASLNAALDITTHRMKEMCGFDGPLNLAVLSLGKFGGRGMDYGSDLDLVVVHEENSFSLAEMTATQFYTHAVEVFVACLSAFTRDGHLYRVDLRLRPDGRNGATSASRPGFLDYMEKRSAVWEWLAYVKLRPAAGSLELAAAVGSEALEIIHRRAREIPADELAAETIRIRERLGQEKTRGSKNVNIKFGAGGMLDIYFATRFLQLRDDVRDDPEDRSTIRSLEKLRNARSLLAENFASFSSGYFFLSRLDHAIRIAVSRTSEIPAANQGALQNITRRMNLPSAAALLEQLTVHRLEIRKAFENVVK
jgi:[glutamine synthetase] adenylyltransferase / [glutamine synthetase]-adenylyl-L-tyrosine phosphorylase